MIESAVLAGAGVVLVVSAILVLYRVVRGPGAVDRAIANELLVSIMICAIGIEAAVSRHASTISLLVSLALVGFVSSVAIARFIGRDRGDS